MSRCTPEGCRRKRERGTAFQTKKYAKKIAKEMTRKHGKKIECFHCPHCSLWHVGKPWIGDSHG